MYEIVSPNLYTLHGFGVKVVYATTSISGKPILTYTSPLGSHEFTGPGIEVTQSPIGQVVSVVVEEIPDMGCTRLAVLLPTVRLSTQHTETHITAEAVLTQSRGAGISGQLPEGQLDHYSVHRLFGTAAFVQF